MGKYMIFKGVNGQYYFNLKAGNGERILASEGYISRSSCDNGISSVKFNAGEDRRYDRKMSKNGKHYFVLKAGNGEIIGMSEMYETTGGREKGIAAVKKEGPWAVIEHVD